MTPDRKTSPAPLSTRRRGLEVLLLAAPVLFGQVSTVLVGFVDTWFVGHVGDGRKPLAALGATATVFLVVFLVFSSLATGVQAMVSRRIGEGRERHVGRILESALTLGLIIGAVAGLLGVLLPRHVMPLLTEDPETAALATGYLQWRWGLGMPFIVLSFVFRGFFWGTGLTRTDLFVSLCFNAANLLLDWMLIFGNLGAPALGAPGAGLASALANVFAASLFLTMALRPKIRRRFAFLSRPRLDPRHVRRIFRLSLPRAIQATAFSMSIAFFAVIRLETGDEGLAASQIIWRCVGLTVLVAIGIGTASATLVGRELGAGRPEEARAYGRAASWMGFVAVGGVASLLFVTAPLLFSSVTDDAETRARLLEIGVPAFRLVMLFQIVDAIGLVYARTLQGAGDVVYVMAAEFVVAWSTAIPVALLGARVFTDTPLLGVWCGWGAYCVGWAAAMRRRFRSGRWQAIRI